MERSHFFTSKLYPKKFLNSEKKNSKDNFLRHKFCFPKKCHPKKISFFVAENPPILSFRFCHFRFWSNFFFQKYVFQKCFFDRPKKIGFFLEFFSELRKKCWYSFDVENSDLSIYEVFSAFWARQIQFIECQRQRDF